MSKCRLLASCGAVVLVLALIGCGRSDGQKHDPASQVTSANDGLPQTLAELDAWYVEPPAEQNAATFYLKGFNALQLRNVSPNIPLLGKAKLPPPGAPMSTLMKSAMTALVQSNRDALQFFAQGTKHDQSRYPVDLTQGVDAPFPHLPRLKNAAMLVELTAISHAEAGEGKQAAEDVLAVLGLARSLEAEPALLSQLIRAATVSTAVAALEQVLNRTMLPRESLNELVKVFLRMENCDARGEGFNRAMTAERATSMALLGTPQKLAQVLAAPGVNIPADQRDHTLARLQKGDNLKNEQLYYEATFQDLMTARKEAFPERLKADGLVRQRVTEAGGRKLPIIAVILPGLAGRTAREAECLAHVRLGLTAVALERFREAHDHCYPATLSELTPEYLTATCADPFDGQPLRYRRKGAGYMLYSVGSDLKDDSCEPMNGPGGDIGFVVVTPAKSGNY